MVSSVNNSATQLISPYLRNDQANSPQQQGGAPSKQQSLTNLSSGNSGGSGNTNGGRGSLIDILA